MKRLVEAGLFGAGLVPIDTPELVRRYNAALKELGIEPTGLDRFDIDGIGWSPQVAGERKDNFYLCAGIANPMGVIITPNQRAKPLHLPYSSYERDMMDAYFARHHGAITDITSTSFIGLDIDQELTAYETPYDLALVRYVVLRSVAGGLFDAARHQRKLVERFSSNGLEWFDPKLRSDLIESAKTWGDLRHRRADIPPFRFEIKSFYTRAFNGVFVLYAPKSEKKILVVKDAELLRGPDEGSCDAVTINDPSLYDFLLREQLVELSLAWYAQHPEVLADKRETMLAHIICAAEPDIDYVGLKVAQKRQMTRKYRSDLPKTFHLLERLSSKLEGGQRPKVMDLDPDLRALLVRPHRRLLESEQDVIWRVLCRLQHGSDVFRTYASEKEIFFGDYQAWPASKREWAINLIRERYVPRMSK